MTSTRPDWEQRLSALWASIDEYGEVEFVAAIEALAAELPVNSAVAAFERASSLDSTGQSDVEVPLYRQALAFGLEGIRRRRAVIQMASSLRNIGQATESVTLLTAEQNEASDELDDAVAATLALALVDTGREREAVSVALTALSSHMTRYRRSMANYAKLLIKHDNRPITPTATPSASTQPAPAPSGRRHDSQTP